MIKKYKESYRKYKEHPLFRITDFNKKLDIQYRRDILTAIMKEVEILYTVMIILGVVIFFNRDFLGDIVVWVWCVCVISLFTICLIVKMLKAFYKSFFSMYLFFVLLTYGIGYVVIEMLIKSTEQWYRLVFHITLIILVNIIFIMIMPPYILKEVQNRQTLFMSVITIFSAIITILFATYGESFVMQISDIPESRRIYEELLKCEFPSIEVRDWFIKNRDDIQMFIKEVEKYFVTRNVDQIVSKISLAGTYVSFFYIIGSILISFKVSINSKKAENLFREGILEENLNYEKMVECVYYGGKEYENIFLANDSFRKTIYYMENDSHSVEGRNS